MSVWEYIAAKAVPLCMAAIAGLYLILVCYFCAIPFFLILILLLSGVIVLLLCVAGGEPTGGCKCCGAGWMPCRRNI